MAMKYVSEAIYALEDVRFRNVHFTDYSSAYLTWPAAIAFTKESHAVLQSAREAAAVRIEAEEWYNPYLRQATRTVIAYFRQNGKWFGAVDDSVDPEENIVLARAQEGYEAHRAHDSWALPKTDRHVHSLLNRAQRKDRMFAVGEQSQLELATRQSDGKSPFGQHHSVRAILTDVSEDYAAFLTNINSKTAYLDTPSPGMLEELELGQDKVEILLVCLCDVYKDKSSICAGYTCTDVGRARGVFSKFRHKNPP